MIFGIKGRFIALILYICLVLLIILYEIDLMGIFLIIAGLIAILYVYPRNDKEDKKEDKLFTEVVGK